MYKQYIEEITRRKVIQTDEYFVHYNMENGVVFIKDMFVLPEYRDGATAYNIWKVLKRMCVLNEISLLAAYIHIDNPKLAEHLRAYRRMGFNISALDIENRFLITKEM